MELSKQAIEVAGCLRRLTKARFLLRSKNERWFQTVIDLRVEIEKVAHAFAMELDLNESLGVAYLRPANAEIEEALAFQMGRKRVLSPLSSALVFKLRHQRLQFFMNPTGDHAPLCTLEEIREFLQNFNSAKIDSQFERTFRKAVEELLELQIIQETARDSGLYEITPLCEILLPLDEIKDLRARMDNYFRASPPWVPVENKTRELPMLDNGYSLARFELLNWGNFHGYQSFNLRPDVDGGPLFAPPSASVILGVNGSGKSTLIDALMIALLPFEGSVKLGVTNDVEAGSAGGRTIRDYVLGKHSSTAGRDGGTLAGSMGRKDGCSIVLLSFRHNRNREKSVTIGRIWWYQNYVVSDTQLAFLSYDMVSISQLCPEGKTPRAPKFFRQHCKEQLPQLQVFDTMQAYFSAISGSFGKINRDDLRILNRAFFVKSISQIDHFIRENMLIEQENPHLERLQANVRNGKEIAFAIETCERKIAAIERILRDLQRLSEGAEKRMKLEQRTFVLALHKEWDDLRTIRDDVERTKKMILTNEGLLPEVSRAVEDARRQQAAIQSMIIHNDLDARLQKLDIESKYLAEKVAGLQSRLAAFETKALALEIKLPRKSAAWSSFQTEIVGETARLELSLTGAKQSLEERREERFHLDAEVKSIRDEMQHLATFKTLIPKDLHAIKIEAMDELRIPAGRLCFVGELIQVTRSEARFRRAIESVLFPVSRNLLCHPEHLEAFTKWINARGLRTDVVAKRISFPELESRDEAWEGSARRLTGTSFRLGVSERKTIGMNDGERSTQDFVLDKIDVLPEEQHPFTAYLWQWLRAKFDYKIVELKELRGAEEQLVTIEGLVKSDRRTMRKLKQHLPFSLGWDPTERIAELADSLRTLSVKLTAGTDRLKAAEAEIAGIEDKRRLYEELRPECSALAELEGSQSRLELIRREHAALLKQNPDYKKLKEQEVEIDRQLRDLQKRQSQFEAGIEEGTKKIRTLEALVPKKEKELRESLMYGRLRDILGGETFLTEALGEVDGDLAKRKLTRLEYDTRLRGEIEELQKSIDRSRLQANNNILGYKRDFNDPNLSYEIPAGSEISSFISEWGAAEARLRQTELPQVQEKWRRFFDHVLMESVRDMINEIRAKVHDTERSISSINEVLKLTNFEDLPGDQRYLVIDLQTSTDDRIRRFRRSIDEIGKILGPGVRAQAETQSQQIMSVLVPFVEEFQSEPSYRDYVTDVRNHFQFEVHSLRRREGQPDERVEVFTGARRDAKSSAQTTQLAYALLASCLAFRFKFHDPVAGHETPRILVLDEFGGKFDNEKPREILKLLDKMGFQSILVSPMSKADLLADGVSQMIFVHKSSATHSKVQSFEVTSKQDYDRLIATMMGGQRGAESSASA